MAEPERIGELIRQLLKRRGLRQKRAVQEVARVLEDVLGRELSGQVRVRDTRGGTLRMSLASASLREELSVYRSSEVLSALQTRLPNLGIRGIRFETQ